MRKLINSRPMSLIGTALIIALVPLASLAAGSFVAPGVLINGQTEIPLEVAVSVLVFIVGVTYAGTKAWDALKQSSKEVSRQLAELSSSLKQMDDKVNNLDCVKNKLQTCPVKIQPIIQETND